MAVDTSDHASDGHRVFDVFIYKEESVLDEGKGVLFGR